MNLAAPSYKGNRPAPEFTEGGLHALEMSNGGLHAHKLHPSPALSQDALPDVTLAPATGANCSRRHAHKMSKGDQHACAGVFQFEIELTEEPLSLEPTPSPAQVLLLKLTQE